MIYGISDLHLDYTGEKSMEVFGPNWIEYEERIIDNWRSIVGESDTVLVPGDISWGMKLSEALVDLIRIDELPGKKIFMKGNHDYWWQSLSKLNRLDLKTVSFLQNNSYEIEGTTIVGTRGWTPRDSSEFLESDEVVYARELIRLELSLKHAARGEYLLAMLHYPPFNRNAEPNEFAKLLELYGVDRCVYGHLHGEGLRAVVEGQINGVEYSCISADYLDFKPLRIR